MVIDLLFLNLDSLALSVTINGLMDRAATLLECVCVCVCVCLSSKPLLITVYEDTFFILPHGHLTVTFLLQWAGSAQSPT